MHISNATWFRFASLVFLIVLGATPAAKGQGATREVGPAEKDLDAISVVTLGAGQGFRISVPLRPSRAVNLGAARLDVTLSGTGKHGQPEPELHLVAILTEAQTTLAAGDGQLILHGVAPQFAAERAGEYHPSDYSIHLGSGNVTNIGVPDDKLIDTERLTAKLQKLRLRLTAATPR